MKVSLICKDLTKLDFAYFDKRHGPLGESLIVDVELLGTQDKDGFIFDFSYAKKTIKSVIDEVIDHKFVISRDHVSTDADGQLVFQTNDIVYSAPTDAFCLLESKINNTSLEKYLEHKIIEKMPDNIKKVKVILRPEKNPETHYYFRYTHGLKNHYGNCQRLLHGHRSTLMIWVDGERSNSLEKFLVSEFLKNSVHFIFWDNVVNKDAISSTPAVGRLSKEVQVHLKYTSGQGEFQIKIPSKMCYFLDVETSIENLTQHFVKVLKDHVDSKQSIKLYLCEGISKGATSVL